MGKLSSVQKLPVDKNVVGGRQITSYDDILEYEKATIGPYSIRGITRNCASSVIIINNHL